VQRKRKDKIRLTLNPCHNRVLFLVTVVCLFVCLFVVVSFAFDASTVWHRRCVVCLCVWCVRTPVSEIDREQIYGAGSLSLVRWLA
jgi:hypothetical protein